MLRRQKNQKVFDELRRWEQKVFRAYEYKAIKIPKLREPNNTIRQINFGHIIGTCRRLEPSLECDGLFHLFLEVVLYKKPPLKQLINHD